MVFNVKIGLLYECFPAEEDLILPSGETILLLFFFTGMSINFVF